MAYDDKFFLRIQGVHDPSLVLMYYFVLLYNI